MLANEGQLVFGFLPSVPANTPLPTIEIQTQWHLIDYQPIQSSEIIPDNLSPNTLAWTAFDPVSQQIYFPSSAPVGAAY